MFASTLLTALSCASLATANFAPNHGPFVRRDTSSNNTVQVTTLSKSSNSTGGSAQVAAGGQLAPFGGIGVGCGINWKDNVSFGGGLQGGSSSFGLGGGYTILPHSMEIGAGIGYTKSNNSASINFSSTDDGAFVMQFQSTEPFGCVPGRTTEGTWTVVCTTQGGNGTANATAPMRLRR